VPALRASTKDLVPVLAMVVVHVGFGHTDAGIDDGEGFGVEVGNDLDFHIEASVRDSYLIFIEGI